MINLRLRKKFSIRKKFSRIKTRIKNVKKGKFLKRTLCLGTAAYSLRFGAIKSGSFLPNQYHSNQTIERVMKIKGGHLNTPISNSFSDVTNGMGKSGPKAKAQSKLARQKQNPSDSLHKTNSGKTETSYSEPSSLPSQAPTLAPFKRRSSAPSAHDMPVPSKLKLRRVNENSESLENDQQVAIRSDSNQNSKVSEVRGGEGLFGERSRKPTNEFETHRKGFQQQQMKEANKECSKQTPNRVSICGSAGEVKTVGFEAKDGTFAFNLEGGTGAGGAGNMPDVNNYVRGPLKIGLDTYGWKTATNLDKTIINKAADCIGQTADNSFTSNVTSVAVTGCSRAASGDMRYAPPCLATSAGSLGLASIDLGYTTGKGPAIGGDLKLSPIAVGIGELGLHKTAELIIEDSQPALSPPPIMDQFFK